ncbi:MAG: hypothetical protein A2033_09385 [Bacteroidetes bacterium GWA2_31_9]|nr:MAG: hypothetical protein A2033_09385 [Bacteroidetes bacterium GWA2_31_9]
MLPTFRNLNQLPNLMDDFFGKDLMSNFFENKTKFSIPSVNVNENKNEFSIEVAAPGLSKDDFKIDIENNVLTISSEKEEQYEENEKKVIRREFSYNCFKRSFTLPETVNAEQISATHKDGILNIVLPKREEAKEKPARQIAIS